MGRIDLSAAAEAEPGARGPEQPCLAQEAGLLADETEEEDRSLYVDEDDGTEGQLFWKKVADESWVRGHQRGVEEREIIGTAKALVTLLERRYGRLSPEQQARLFAASEAELGERLLRAIDGVSPPELLGPGADPEL